MTDRPAQYNRHLPRLRMAVLMTCHNRVLCTTKSVRALKAQIGQEVSQDIYLVDDGSSDGTAQTLMEFFPEATILTGDGSLFWCGGTRWAFGEAIKSNYDFYLWLNDDTYLEYDALARLVNTYQDVSKEMGEAIILVGSVRDPETGHFTYGGWRQKPGKFGLISWHKIPPDMERPITCDTMNGNCVLIPRAVVGRVGNLDPIFLQGIGDIDYGLRAIKSGCQIIIAPGYYGVCKSNDGSGSWSDTSLPIYSRWKKLIGPKGFPVNAWGVFTRRHKGPLWFFAWMAPYILFWFNVVSSFAKDRS